MEIFGWLMSDDNKTQIEEIILAYKEKGHTFLYADAVHARIEKKVSSRKNPIYSRED